MTFSYVMLLLKNNDNKYKNTYTARITNQWITQNLLSIMNTKSLITKKSYNKLQQINQNYLFKPYYILQFRYSQITFWFIKNSLLPMNYPRKPCSSNFTRKTSYSKLKKLTIIKSTGKWMLQSVLLQCSNMPISTGGKIKFLLFVSPRTHKTWSYWGKTSTYHLCGIDSWVWGTLHLNQLVTHKEKKE